MVSKKPVKHLKSGQAQIIEHPKQLAHILWAASRGETGRRNVALLWFLFGSGCRINETVQLRVKDIYYPTGDLKHSFSIPGSYTKTGKPRTVYILARQQRDALSDLKEQRIVEKVMLNKDGAYGGLLPDSPIFLSKKR